MAHILEECFEDLQVTYYNYINRDKKGQVDMHKKGPITLNLVRNTYHISDDLKLKARAVRV